MLLLRGGTVGGGEGGIVEENGLSVMMNGVDCCSAKCASCRPGTGVL